MSFKARPDLFLEMYFFPRHAKLGEKLLKALLVGFTVFSFAVHITNDFSLKLDVMDSLLSTVYMVPWTRIGPYRKYFCQKVLNFHM